MVPLNIPPLWLELLIFATVLITVLSGADYFFGLRRGLAQYADGQRAASGDQETGP